MDYYKKQIIQIVMSVLIDDPVPTTYTTAFALATRIADALIAQSYVQATGIGGPTEYNEAAGRW